MKSYNGYTPKQRMSAFYWLKAQIAKGLRKNACQCEVCGQREQVSLHSEDYSFPYGDHIGAYELCFTCHMMIHCRFNNQGMWKQYIKLVDSGLQVQSVKNWATFLSLFIKKQGQPTATMNGSSNAQILINIENGLIKSSGTQYEQSGSQEVRINKPDNQ